MKLSGVVLAIAIGLTLMFGQGISYAGGMFTVAIMQDDKDAAKKFIPLEAYLAKKGIKLVLDATPNYSTAAYRFESGKVDAMFSGSSVAGIFILKGLAEPVVRPVDKEDSSTYHAVVLAKKGSPKFSGDASYFSKKRVAFSELASSGEVFFRSIPKVSSSGAIIVKMSSHGAAIEALSKGAVDIAIVKNHVWDKHASEYPNIIKVGEDNLDNPDGTLIISVKSKNAAISEVTESLLSLGKDDSPEAKAVREQMGVKKYIKTTKKDFAHTLNLLKKAGVNESFDFKFK